MGGEGRSSEAGVETEVQPVVHLVALAPPEEALRVVENAGAIAELDQFEKIVDVGAGEKNGVGEIHDDGRGRVVADDHVSAEQRRAAAGVEKTRAASAGEAQNSANDVRWPRRNAGDYGSFATRGAPPGYRTGFREVALPRLENHAELMHAGRNASRRGGRAAAGSSESARRCGEGEVRGIVHGSDGKMAVVTA